jgi:aspartate aminotransferase
MPQEKSKGYKIQSNAGYPEGKAGNRRSSGAGEPNSSDGRYIVMTVGAAGGLNVVFKALLNPGEEVIVFAPYFVEINFMSTTAAAGL